MSGYPEGTIYIEIRSIYDGWSVAQFPDGTLHNRWKPDDDRRFTATQAWIDARKEQPE